MKKSKIAKFVSLILMSIFIVGIICIPFVPSLYDFIKEESIPYFNNHTLIYKIAFYTCYILCLVIVFELINLFNEIYKGSPFKKKVENILKVVAIIFMILFVIVLIKNIFIPTIITFAVIILCFIASLSFYVLAEVIKAAIAYKDEIDYTV